MKITDVTLTLFAWNDIPATTTARTPAVQRQEPARPARIETDQGVRATRSWARSMLGPPDGQSLIQSSSPCWWARTRSTASGSTRGSGKRSAHDHLREIGAVDVALWDIAGKVAGLPIHELLGTYRESVPAYTSSAVLSRARPTPRRRASTREGLERVQDPPADRPEEDIRVCEAVRQAVGDDYRLMLDAAWSYDYPQALRVGQAVEELGFHWYEDPLADNDIYNYVQLREKLAHPDHGNRIRPGRLHRLRALDHCTARPTTCAATSR